jgi:sorbitol-specific phosphotransferase system component IIC
MPKLCLIQIIGENTVSKVGQLIGRKMVLKYGKNSFIGRIMGCTARKALSQPNSTKAHLDKQ